MNWLSKDKYEVLKPVEVALSVYLLYSTVLIAVFYSSIEKPLVPIAFRIFVIVTGGILTSVKQTEIIRFFRTFFPFVLLGYLYSETDILNNLFFPSYFDRWFSSIDERIFGFQPSLVFAEKVSSGLFTDLMYFGYFSYFLMSFGIPLIIYFKAGKEKGERMAFIIINSFMLYYMIFTLLPVAGPQYYFQGTDTSVLNGYIFEPITKLIQHFGERPTGAFPSSHVSICLMLLYGSFQYYRKLLYAIVPISILLIFSTVYIRAHYFVDVIAGFTFTPIIYAISVMLYRFLTLNPINAIKIYGHSNKRS
jgi:membrane-associated phospholipid phosphatase